MARNFLGRGWKYPVEVDRAGGIAMSELDESIRQSMLIILGTAAHFCIEALSKWEARIDEVEAEAESSGDEPNRLDITIKYKVRATNTSRNLVYPFYIRRSE